MVVSAKAGTAAVIAAKAVSPATSHVMGPQLVALFGISIPFSLAFKACRKATTVTRFVIVSNDSCYSRAWQEEK